MFTKCPSAPNISHHKLNMEQSITIRVEAVGDANGPPPLPGPDDAVFAPSGQHHQEVVVKKRSSMSSTMYGQYRVLTPTMYRSRAAAAMAATRQAVSMDEGDQDGVGVDGDEKSPGGTRRLMHRSRHRRRRGTGGDEVMMLEAVTRSNQDGGSGGGGSCRVAGADEVESAAVMLRPASLSPRMDSRSGGGQGGGQMGSHHLPRSNGSRRGRHHHQQQQDSLELELGASATRVWGRERERDGGRSINNSGNSPSGKNHLSTPDPQYF